MLSRLRNNGLVKFLWAIMGLYLLNISIDAADPHPNHIPENLSINDQESIVEIVVEQLLGFENAFEEYDDNDSDDHNSESNAQLKVKFFVQSTSKTLLHISLRHKIILKSTKKLFPQDFFKVESPPPEV
ncbi:hypothetical protein ACFSSG_00145 [Euzebyella marina]|uniref:hypothetical protein n=1 Tax=Euzebyella marina TaxID=1761453 RepID=UPI00177EC4A9|nr:hypothetical protein [Euzebyella marina]